MRICVQSAASNPQQSSRSLLQTGRCEGASWSRASSSHHASSPHPVICNNSHTMARQITKDDPLTTTTTTMRTATGRPLSSATGRRLTRCARRAARPSCCVLLTCAALCLQSYGASPTRGRRRSRTQPTAGVRHRHAAAERGGCFPPPNASAAASGKRPYAGAVGRRAPRTAPRAATRPAPHRAEPRRAGCPTA